MKAEKGDVIRFYFSESTGCTKERTNDNTEMVDIVVVAKGELVAVSDFGGGCYLSRLEDAYTILGDLNDTEAIDALLSSGWRDEHITDIKESFNL